MFLVLGGGHADMRTWLASTSTIMITGLVDGPQPDAD